MYIQDANGRLHLEEQLTITSLNGASQDALSDASVPLSDMQLGAVTFGVVAGDAVEDGKSAGSSFELDASRDAQTGHT